MAKGLAAIERGGEVWSKVERKDEYGQREKAKGKGTRGRDDANLAGGHESRIFPGAEPCKPSVKGMFPRANCANE